MLASRSAVVSSALLFILGAGGLHPALDACAATGTLQDTVPQSLSIEEFYPCAVDGDEYLVLSNRGSEAVNLLGWTLSDGEGSLTFLGGVLRPSQRLSLSEDASSYAAVYGAPPDLCVDGWTSGDGVSVSGRFRLADAGDALLLCSPDGACADAVVYGDSPAPATGWSGDPVPSPRRGEVLRRSPSPVPDSDTSLDWTHFRELRYGCTDCAGATHTVQPGRLTCFTSPDCSLDVVSDVISGAQTSVRLCSYELSSAAVSRCLCEAVSRGVSVRVLVDAHPVGGMSGEQVSCLSFLSRSGADVRVVGGNLDDGVVKHVGALHAKYLIVDDETLVVLSENFVEDGVPSDRLFGNRGWGISVSDEEIASCAVRVFDEDSRPARPDVSSWADDPRYDPAAQLPDPVRTAHTSGTLQPLTVMSEASVSLYFSPDSSFTGPFLERLVSSSSEVVFEQFQADLQWLTRWSDEPVANPVLEAVAKVAACGGSAKGMFDGSWFNVEANSEALAYLESVAPSSEADARFRLLPERSPISLLHNKGLVLGPSCVVSSNNWVYASFAKNRELAASVRCPEASEYFIEAFMMDWVPDTSAPVADAGRDIELPAPGEVMLDASNSSDDRALAVFSWYLDGDSVPDLSGEKAVFTAPSPGTYVIRLEVEDAWGNRATDSLTLTVGQPGTHEMPPPPRDVPAPWFAPAAACAGLAALLAARKVNLLRASSQSKGQAQCSSGVSSRGTRKRSRVW